MEGKDKNYSVVCTYVYKDSIQRVFDCYRTPRIFHSVLKHAGTIEIKKGEFYSEIGTVVVLGWKNVFSVEFEVQAVVDKENYKMLKYYTTKVEPFDLKYTLCFHFYWNSVENCTLFVHEMTFDNSEALKTLDLNHDRKEKLEIFQGIEKILLKLSKDLFQDESILIETDINSLWTIITDWRKLKFYVPFVHCG